MIYTLPCLFDVDVADEALDGIETTFTTIHTLGRQTNGEMNERTKARLDGVPEAWDVCLCEAASAGGIASFNKKPA